MQIGSFFYKLAGLWARALRHIVGDLPSASSWQQHPTA